jgi:hypothetical protein
VFERARDECRTVPARSGRARRRDMRRLLRWRGAARHPAIRAGSMGAELLLVEHALVESWREAHVVHVALLQVDATAELTPRDHAVLANDSLEQVRSVDRQGAAGPGHEEVGANVPTQVREPECAGSSRVEPSRGRETTRGGTAAEHGESTLRLTAGLTRHGDLGRRRRLGRDGRGHARDRAQSERRTPSGAGPATRLGTSWLQRLPHSNGGSAHRTGVQRTPGVASGMRR